MSTPWWFFLIAAGLIVMSGFFSGLNLGLMSLAPDELKVVMEGSQARARDLDGHEAHFEAQVSESSRFYAARGALLMRFEVKRA